MLYEAVFWRANDLFHSCEEGFVDPDVRITLAD
jgi:hypothetical protein